MAVGNWGPTDMRSVVFTPSPGNCHLSPIFDQQEMSLWWSLSLKSVNQWIRGQSLHVSHETEELQS